MCVCVCFGVGAGEVMDAWEAGDAGEVESVCVCVLVRMMVRLWTRKKLGMG